MEPSVRLAVCPGCVPSLAQERILSKWKRLKEWITNAFSVAKSMSANGPAPEIVNKP